MTLEDRTLTAYHEGGHALTNLLLPIDSAKPFNKNVAALKNVAAKQKAIPVKTSTMSTATDKPRKINYRVKQGDSLYRISNLFSASIGQLSSWNNLTQSNYLKPGQILTVYVNT